MSRSNGQLPAAADKFLFGETLTQAELLELRTNLIAANGLCPLNAHGMVPGEYYVALHGSTSELSVALGAGASFSADYATAIGAESASASHGTAVGKGAVAGEYSVALGQMASASAHGVAIGLGVTAASGAVNIGGGVQNDYSVNVGQLSIGGIDSVSVGNLANAYDYSIAVGKNSVSATGAVALGTYAQATADYSVAVGNKASASSLYGLAIGHGATSSNVSALSIGFGSDVSGLNSILVSSVESAVSASAMAVDVIAGSSARLSVRTSSHGKSKAVFSAPHNLGAPVDAGLGVLDFTAANMPRNTMSFELNAAGNALLVYYNLAGTIKTGTIAVV